MGPVQVRIEAQDRPLQPAVVLQELTTEVFFVRIDAQIVPVELHLAEAVAQGHDPFHAAELMVEPVAEVVARSRMLQAEPLHAQEAPALLRDHAETPLATIHVIGELALDAQIGFERPVPGFATGLHVVVAFGHDHPALACAGHHRLQLFKVLVVNADADDGDLHIEACRIIVPPLRDEDAQTGVPLSLERPIAPESSGDTQHAHDGQGPKPLPAVPHHPLKSGAK